MGRKLRVDPRKDEVLGNNKEGLSLDLGVAVLSWRGWAKLVAEKDISPLVSVALSSFGK